jgi:hypothetical protein
MTDYSNEEAYLIRGEFMYATARYYYPFGNDPKRYPQSVGAGRPMINYNLSNAGSRIGNPYADSSCFLQTPLAYMETVPFDRRACKFSDCYFYKGQRFAPGSN